MLPEFRCNDDPTVGVELELMLLDPQSLDLAAVAVKVQNSALAAGLGEHVKLEITQSMIEVNSSVHTQVQTLCSELRFIGSELARAAQANGVQICGGGTHPFHRWQERALSPTQRFHELGHHYGYLAKQFTVFGQHIHVGCRGGDDAIRIVNQLALFVPHFIALSAASPFHRGVDTSFDSCRLNMIAAFPLAGRMPAIETWLQFETFFERLEHLKIVSGIKDLYWDIRPKPEFGTVEVRIPDTPLDVVSAADLAAYVQVLAQWSRELESVDWLDDFVYQHNRFQAARFGYDGRMIVGGHGERFSVGDHLRYTFDQVAKVAERLGCATSLDRLASKVTAGTNDATWLREQYALDESLVGVMERSSRRWSASLVGDDRPPTPSSSV